MTSLIIADDQPIVRAGIRNTILEQPDLQVVGETCHTEMVFYLLKDLQPDVIILDAQLSGQDTAEVVNNIKNENMSAQVLIFSNEVSTSSLIRFIQAGAGGWVSKSVDPDVLLDAIRAVARGNSYFSQDVTHHIRPFFSTIKFDKDNQIKLTRQESKILNHAALGLSNCEIANRFSITERTVEFHMSNILTKLEVKNRLEAVMKAQELCLV